jgi:soluble lytic murein transglycosylase-like protein
MVAALAAYNAGETNVAAWGGGGLNLDDIQFPETRDYVEDVLDKRDEYAQHYRHELGLD